MFYWCIDVVTAYKELQREKIALEESLKALSVSRPSSDEYPIQAQKDVDLASEHLAEDSSICSELSDSLVTHVKYLLLYMYLGWLRIRNSILDRWKQQICILRSVFCIRVTISKTFGQIFTPALEKTTIYVCKVSK